MSSLTKHPESGVCNVVDTFEDILQCHNKQCRIMSSLTKHPESGVCNVVDTFKDILQCHNKQYRIMSSLTKHPESGVCHGIHDLCVHVVVQEDAGRVAQELLGREDGHVHPGLV